MLDLKQLKYFIVCAETGSISEAAKLLYTTQPSVSKAIKALEEELLAKINGIGLGPAGLGGDTTALAKGNCAYGERPGGIPICVQDHK